MDSRACNTLAPLCGVSCHRECPAEELLGCHHPVLLESRRTAINTFYIAKPLNDMRKLNSFFAPALKGELVPISFMLRLVLLLIAVLLPLMPAQAQVLRGYGLKLGPTASDINSPDLEFEGGDPLRFDTVRRYGVAAFVYAEWFSQPFFSLVTEAGYTQRGFAIEYEGRDAQNNPSGTVRTDDRFDYLSTSMLLKARLPLRADAPYVLAGPRLDFFLGGSPSGEGTLASAYSSTAFGGSIGLGVEVDALEVLTLFVESRYGFDVTNSLPDVPRDAYNTAFDLLIGIRL
ncbi:MAG: porin family protein [Bacteroidota bacterium]